MLFPELTPPKETGRRVSAKARELLRRYVQAGALYTRGPGEASSRRALKRAGLLDMPTAPDTRALAEVP